MLVCMGLPVNPAVAKKLGVPCPDVSMLSNHQQAMVMALLDASVRGAHGRQCDGHTKHRVRVTVRAPPRLR